MDDDLREKAAKAAYDRLRAADTPPWDQADGMQRMCAFIVFDAVSDAIESAGYRIVPVEPTEEMVGIGVSTVRVGANDRELTQDIPRAYRAMRAAYGQGEKS